MARTNPIAGMAHDYDDIPGTFVFDAEKSRQGYGYLLIEVNSTTLTVKMIGVNGLTTSDVDRVAVDLATSRAV